jgi:branched-chain amino acid transport system ATP-binding protein
VHFDGHDLTRFRLHQIVRLGIAFAVEGRRTFPEQTVHENLLLGAYKDGGINERTASRLDDVLDLFPVLREKASIRSGLLSGGQRQMLAIGQALMSAPKLLVLDEPSAGLAPRLTAEMFDALRQLTSSGMSLLLAEQAVGHALALCDRGYVLKAGQVVLEDTTSALRADAAVQAAYIGSFVTDVAAGSSRQS